MSHADRGHYFDEDAVCVDCGFDGAEWHYWCRRTARVRMGER